MRLATYLHPETMQTSMPASKIQFFGHSYPHYLLLAHDGHIHDCGRDITNWSGPDFRRLTQLLLTAAAPTSCPLVSVQGGGYNLPVTIATTMAHVEVLAGKENQ